jgi:hypothetical protein
VKRLLLRNPIRGGQGPNWAVEPCDDDDDDDILFSLGGEYEDDVFWEVVTSSS